MNQKAEYALDEMNNVFRSFFSLFFLHFYFVDGDHNKCHRKLAKFIMGKSFESSLYA